MSGIAKTNAARLLDGLGIAYSLHNAPVDVHDLSAVTMAHSLHVSEDIVFKTLVLRGDKNGVLMACIPAAAELDLKKLAAATGNKQVHMVLLKEVQGLTGYIRGGCSPLAAKKNYPVTIDETALLYEHIYVSAGQRGVQLCLAPDDLIAATQGQYADILR
ncbi:MAG: Cys-tRNA(Pro) deacylase [Desulfovibrionaceae bacterium]|nr:Cys-tRNA(Pro) deacylase [Desulfovibrionaceae bacterium]